HGPGLASRERSLSGLDRRDALRLRVDAVNFEPGAREDAAQRQSHVAEPDDGDHGAALADAFLEIREKWIQSPSSTLLWRSPDSARARARRRAASPSRGDTTLVRSLRAIAPRKASISARSGSARLTAYRVIAPSLTPRSRLSAA